MTNSYCHRKETFEIKPAPESLGDKILEENIWKALSLAGVNVTPEQLNLCHLLKKQSHVIIKLKCRKQRQNALFSRKNLKEKSSELTQL